MEANYNVVMASLTIMISLSILFSRPYTIDRPLAAAGVGVVALRRLQVHLHSTPPPPTTVVSRLTLLSSLTPVPLISPLRRRRRRRRRPARRGRRRGRRSQLSPRWRRQPTRPTPDSRPKRGPKWTWARRKASTASKVSAPRIMLEAGLVPVGLLGGCGAFRARFLLCTLGANPRWRRAPAARRPRLAGA